MKLFPQNSAEDLILRGFEQNTILARTGVDPGYHNCKFKTELKGIDRIGYKAAYIKSVLSQAKLDTVLEQYAVGQLDKDGILGQLGVYGDRTLQLKDLFKALGMEAEFKSADTRHRKSNMKAGMVVKYGTDNPFKLDEFQQQAAQTRTEKYGAAYTLQKGSSLEPAARQKSIVQSHTAEAEQKRQATTKARFGVDSVLAAPEVREKAAATMLSRYGAEHYMQSDEGRERNRQRMKRDAKAIVTKAQATNLKKYGKPFYTQTVEFRKKQSAQVRAELDEHMTRLRRAMRQKYGVDFNMQRPEMRKALGQYVREHAAELQAKSVVTCLERYGVRQYAQTEEFRQKQGERMRIKMANEATKQDYLRKACETKRKNGTFSTSVPEERLYILLVDEFGEEDVLRQYKSEVYPFHCDFYIQSRDMYIELNAHWTHGGHWFGTEIGDGIQAEQWCQKESGLYQSGFKTWTQRDVEKRKTAKQYALNYVVFWTCDLSDAACWFELGCPDGQDWRCEFSWL